MALLLLKVRHENWFKEAAAPFLELGDAPADPFVDLRTKQNLLSVWEVEDDRSNLVRVVRGIAVGAQRPDHAGYILFEPGRLEAAEIEIRITAGGSKDNGINGRHRDLVLSGKKLVALARLLLLHGETGVVTKPEILESAEEGIRTGELPEVLRDWLRKK